MKKNTKCPYRKNVVCNYLAMPDNAYSVLYHCTDCPSYVPESENFTDKEKSKFWHVALGILIAGAVAFFFCALINYIRPA